MPAAAHILSNYVPEVTDNHTKGSPLMNHLSIVICIAKTLSSRCQETFDS